MNRRRVLRWLIAVAVVVLVSGCSGTSGPASTVLDLAGDAPPPPRIDADLASVGESLYLRGAGDHRVPQILMGEQERTYQWQIAWQEAQRG